MRDDASIRFDEDVRLMLKAQRGDRQAYARLYGKYAPAVRRYIAGHNGRAEPPEDLVQEVFTRVWEHRGRYRPPTPLCPTCWVLPGTCSGSIRPVYVVTQRSSRVSPVSTGWARDRRARLSAMTWPSG